MAKHDAMLAALLEDLQLFEQTRQAMRQGRLIVASPHRAGREAAADWQAQALALEPKLDARLERLTKMIAEHLAGRVAGAATRRM